MSFDSGVDVRLHKYAFEGKKSKLKSLLKKEQNINLEALDFGGHTALYYACLNGHKGCAKLLLESHANPNERCKNGETAVHAATKSGNTKVLALLIQFGGDLRLHDNEGRAPRAWAMFQSNPNLRRKMLSFIEETRYKAILQSSKQNGSQVYQPSNSQYNIKVPDGNTCSAGFGTLFKSSTDIGVPILVPVINENELVHDSTGLTINNGAFMVYESMKWKDKHFVTVKRLHGNTVEGGCVDLLIEELQILSRINYSKIIQLMGICQTQNIESLILMFERIEKGSLFYIMHEEKSIKAPKLKSIVEIMLTICNALIYLHEQNIIHCYVNSHSVLIVSPHIVKLGNLEFAIEKASDPSKQKKSRVVDSKYTNCAYNWLAPEIMDENDAPNEMSDMYSFCCLFWELFNVAIPWADMEWKQIRDEVLINNNSLQINFDLIPLPFSRIIKDGLDLNSINRMSFEDVKANLENVRGMIYAAKKTASMKKSMSKKAAAAAELNKIKTTGETNYGEVPVDVPLAKQQQRPVRSRSEAYYPAGKNMRKGHTVDDIKSLDESEPANSMATLNSQEFDELSRMTGNSFIYCDAYKAEIHLRKGSLPAAAIQRTASPRPIPTSTSNNSGLSPDGGEKRFSRMGPSSIEHKIESRRRSKRIPRSCTVRPDLAEDSSRTYANPLLNDTLTRKARAASLSQPPPPPPPPPPPQPQVSARTATPGGAKFRSASTNSSAFHDDQQLPRDSLVSPPQSSYTRPNTIPSLPLPPAFAEASSPTKAQNRLRKLRSVSTAGSNEGNVYSAAKTDRVSPLLKQTSPNSACGLMDRKKPLGQRLSNFEPSDKFERAVNSNSARFSSPTPRSILTADENNNMMFLQRNSIDSSGRTPPPPAKSENQKVDTTSVRKDKFKLLETLYYSNTNILLNPANKQRLFMALQRQQMARKEQADREQQTSEDHFERENPFRSQLVPSVASGSQLSPTTTTPGDHNHNQGKGQEPMRSNLLSSIKAGSKDSVNRIDPQTFYSMAKKYVANEETDPESSAHLPPPPSDFELNTKLSAYNSTRNYKELKSIFDNKTASTPDPSADFVRKPVVVNKLSKSYTNLRQSQDLVSSNVGTQSECNYSAGPRRKLVMKTTSLHNNNSDMTETESPKRPKSHSVDTSHRSRLEMSPSHSNGAVKNLVLSYEEIPFKEENESKHKVQMLREQRNKEMLNVVEQSRMILHGLATFNEFGDAQKSGDQDHLEAQTYSNSPQQRGGGMKNSKSEEIQSTTPCVVVNQQNDRPDFQNLLQKELSTISERTEHSSSANCLATIAGSTVNTSFTVPSPQITNAHSNSRQNSVTKSVRHFDPSKINYLDMTSTTIAGSGGNISATGGSSEYLVGNNTLTTTVSSASTALKPGMSRANSSFTPPPKAAAPSARSDYDNVNHGEHATTISEGNNVAGRYVKNARKSFRYSKSNDGSDGSNGGLKAAYDYSNSILKEHFRNIDMKADQLNKVNAHNTFERDTYGEHGDDDQGQEEEEEDEVDEVSEDSDCDSEEEQNEYQSKATRTPYTPSIMDSHNMDYAPPTDQHKFNPNHCNDCMQKFLEQQLIAKNYEHQQQMSREYSSQEDILSSLRGCVESPSMELSEAIYLNEFEMLSKREDDPAANNRNNASNSRPTRGVSSEASRPSVISESTENLRKSFYSSFDRQVSKKKQSTDASVKSNTEQLLNDNSNYMNMSAKSPAEAVRSSKSHSNLASQATKQSPSTSKAAQMNECSSPSTNSIMASTNPTTANVVSSKLGNVRLDKHIIDMSKYKDYIYKLETRSDVSNQYFIKSLLTNEQTGHSLVLSQTKVKTPKMLTKLIIDQ